MKSLKRLYIFILCSQFTCLSFAQSHNIGLELGIQRSYRANMLTELAEGSSAFSEENEAADSPKYLPTYSLSYQYNSNQEWFVKTGISFMNLGFNTPNPNWRLPDEHDSDGGFLGDKRSESYLDLKALSVPFLIGYTWNAKNKLNIELSAGGVVSRVIDPIYFRSYSMDGSTNSSLLDDRESSINVPNFLLGSVIQGGLSYRLNPQISITLNTVFNYYWTRYDTGFTIENFYNNQLNLGVRYNLSSKS